MTDRVIRLLCDAQNYPWGKVGSDSIISQMGPEASGKDWKFSETTPYAELWMTTHPNLPSKLYDSPSTTLSSHLHAHPDLLGVVPQKFPKPVEGKNEKHVPFLFKILTCKQALPLQIHPDKKLAAELHARDPAKFSDANHKPEIACALTPFLGFAGFAPFDRIAANISTIPELADFLAPLPSYQPFMNDSLNSSKLKALVKDILLLNPKSSGILESAKDALKAVTGTQEPAAERGGGDAQGVVRSLIERIEQHGVGSVFGGTMWNEDHHILNNQSQNFAYYMSTIQNLNAFDPFADTGDSEAQPTNYIHIRIQQRNGRKTLTTVQGVPQEYDLKKILKVLKKDFACNGNIVKDDDLGEVIQLQGDQRTKVSEFLTTQLQLPKKNIKIHGF